MYKSQLGQDKWVSEVLSSKRGGYFVELGAGDGEDLSNTFFFEKVLEWNGICIEPNNILFEKLKQNRNCNLSNALISFETGRSVQFSSCDVVSGIIDDFTGPFTIRAQESCATKITKTLSEVLDEMKAPEIIDYLSLDVEGHEYQILSTFPFHRYKFRCITVEHNSPHVGSGEQIKIRKLLELNGYNFVKGNDDGYLPAGHPPIDDYYIFPNL